MSCYAAVVSLKQTIHHQKQSYNRKNNLSCLEMLEFAYEEVRSVQKLLQELDVVSGFVETSDTCYQFWDEYNSVTAILKRGKSAESRGFRADVGFIQRMNALDGKMREAVCELEDALEIHLVNSSTFELDLKQAINSFSETVRELKEAYTKEDDEDQDDVVVSQRIDFCGNNNSSTRMVGFSDVFCQLKDAFLHEDTGRVNKGSLVGMAGLGKTTLAREFFEDPDVLDFFDERVWITVGPKYQLMDIVESILIQVNPSFAGGLPVKADDLLLFLHRDLKGKRCLLVLDDVWNKEIITHIDDLIHSATRCYKDGSLILVTTRLERVGATDRFITIDMLKLRFLTKDESWDLLREKVFGESSSCPPQLEKSGKKIAENCEGLPLTVVTVADILSKAGQMTLESLEYWNNVAGKENSVFVDAYDQMSKVMLQSYDYLPRYLKEYFLYMGVFPQKYNIPLSRLIMLWSAEGCFLLRESKQIRDLRGYLSKHLEELVGKSLVLVRKQSYKHKPKTYGLHSALWHSCVREAGKNKFYHVFNKYADILLAERIKNQRRLCVHNNVLFGIKDVQKSMSSISNARSLLCTGPYHQYPELVCFDNLKLLRVIDALTIRLYMFPTDVLNLAQLRYLALTCDENLPPSISKLSKLQILIVCRYLNISRPHRDESSYLPTKIWDMEELEHLQVMGGDLPDPCDGAVLPNLVTLLDVSPRSCSERVIKGLPKLKKLGIRIEFSVDASAEAHLCCFDHLNKLEALKCVVANPVLRPAPLVSSSHYPRCLRKLNLSGLGRPWEDIKVIGSLPKLEVLKLRCYAFRGPKWEIQDKGFPSLEFLLIEDTDLVQLTMGSESFSKLQCLILKHCYKLRGFERKSRKPLKKIEIVDCSPSTGTCAKQMQKNKFIVEVYVHSSWDDEKSLKG